jgi:hypothetical protein
MPVVTLVALQMTKHASISDSGALDDNARIIQKNDSSEHSSHWEANGHSDSCPIATKMEMYLQNLVRAYSVIFQ